MDQTRSAGLVLLHLHRDFENVINRFVTAKDRNLDIINDNN